MLQPGLKPTTTGPGTRPRRTVFYGWWIVGAGAFMQLLQGTLLGQAYGSYVVVLHNEFGWSRTLLSGASAVREMESGIFGPVQGWFLDRIGPRLVARVGMITLAAGFFIFSQVHSPVTFYAAFLVMSLGASLMGYLTLTHTVVQWFERRRSTALSLMSLGGALGGVILPVTTVLALETLGWRTTAFASGVIVLLVGVPVTQLLRPDPAAMGLRPDGAPPAEPNADGTTPTSGSIDFTLREALRAPSFWWVSLGHASALFVVGAVNVHMVSHLNETLGYSLGRAAGVYSAVTMMFMLGTVFGGWMGDRASKRWLAFGCMGMHAVGMLLLSHATSGLMVAAFVVIHGSAWGMRGPQMAALRADYFGRAAFGKIMGISNMVVIVGSISGPLLAGVIYDHTGSYQVGFDLLALFAALGSIFFALATRPKPPR
ncbi:MAG: MFS transporter [Dehalococcoidia bacterium]|nr:MAG: MFS transporter [Dehalococcoidia bacterium]